MGYWVDEPSGEMRKPLPEEVVPGREEYYMKLVGKEEYHRCSLHHSLEWDKILDLIERNYLYVRKDFKK